jgi:hypothetical protein
MLADPTVDALACALEKLLSSPELGQRLKENAFAFASSASWSAEGDKMAQKLNDIFSSPPPIFAPASEAQASNLTENMPNRFEIVDSIPGDKTRRPI